MSVAMEFEHGITATFSLTAQSCDIHRNIHIMCENGEILADDLEGTITVTHFRRHQTAPAAGRTITVGGRLDGHGGGDDAIMEDFTSGLKNSTKTSRSAITLSVESHLMACAIEKARLTGTVVDMDRYRASLK